MCASHFVREYEHVGIFLQGNIAVPVYSSGEDDPRVTCRFQTRNVFLAPGVIAHDNQLLVGANLFERGNQVMHAIFRDQPANKEHVVLRTQIEPLQPLPPNAVGFANAVGDELSFRMIFLAVIFLDFTRISD